MVKIINCAGKTIFYVNKYVQLRNLVFEGTSCFQIGFISYAILSFLFNVIVRIASVSNPVFLNFVNPAASFRS